MEQLKQVQDEGQTTRAQLEKLRGEFEREMNEVNRMRERERQQHEVGAVGLVAFGGDQASGCGACDSCPSMHVHPTVAVVINQCINAASCVRLVCVGFRVCSGLPPRGGRQDSGAGSGGKAKNRRPASRSHRSRAEKVPGTGLFIVQCWVVDEIGITAKTRSLPCSSLPSLSNESSK